ncbi:CRISPR-associated endonuclease Cas1 [Rheinheimera sp.]|uniref:CRISPR-associated endonuclease Cas1 n=1 Tax=Rheinheimera sp. TaxID=1869214 RepID=UPI003AF900D7
MIEKYHCKLEYDTDVLVLRVADEPMRTIPLRRLEKIICLHNTEVTTQLLGQLYQRRIDFIVLNSRYDSHSVALYGDTHGLANRRCQQYALQLEPGLRLPLAQAICQHKFLVAQRIIKQMGAHRIQSQLEMAFESARQCVTEGQLRGVEGSVQRALFQFWRSQISPEWGFEQRVRRPPPDPVNALLSLTYTLVHQEAVRQCKRYALDPMLGFYHQLAYNRHSLACDLMEPLRPKLDAWLFQFLNAGPLNRRHFSKAKTEGCFLGKEGRLLFYAQFEPQMPMIKRSLAASALWCVRQLKTQPASLLFQAQ